MTRYPTHRTNYFLTINILVDEIATSCFDNFKMLQESGRHSETIDSVTNYLGMGKYSEWDEAKKLEFLAKELQGKRPLIPPTIEVRSHDIFISLNYSAC